MVEAASAMHFAYMDNKKYVSPEAEVLAVTAESCTCLVSSPGPGQNEGTGEEDWI